MYAIGNFTGTVLIENNAILVSNGQSDIFLLQFSLQGALVMAKNFGGDSQDAANAFCIDKEGACYITGSCIDHTTFGNMFFTFPQASRSYVLKVNNAGNVEWAEIGDSTYYLGRFIKQDRNENIVICGENYYVNCTDYCGSYFLSRYDKNGVLLFDAPHLLGTTYVYDFQIDYNNDIVLLRSYSSYSPNKLEKYDSLSNLKWSINHGGGFCYGYKYISFDKDNNIYSTGVYGKSDPPCVSIEINGDTLYRHGIVDLLISKMSSSGNYLWSVHKGGLGYIASGVGGSFFNGKSQMDNEGNLCFFSDYMGDNNRDTVVFNLDTIINDGIWSQSFISKLHVADPIVTSGLKDYNLITPLKLYPNPCSGKFTVKGLTRPTRVYIYDLYGRCVLSQWVREENAILDLSAQEKGIYFLETTVGESKYRSKIIID
ncbi:MAG: hypothetical protein JWO32_382 [Bacteroidetes bacterium]|nr:hypothetical protein [Bacteroidota bacterium]